jgi:hypothetical protein
MLRVIDDSGGPSIWDSRMFETVSESIPQNWKAHLTGSGRLELSPPNWLRSGYWEDYYDGSSDALSPDPPML